MSFDECNGRDEFDNANFRRRTYGVKSKRDNREFA